MYVLRRAQLGGSFGSLNVDHGCMVVVGGLTLVTGWLHVVSGLIAQHSSLPAAQPDPPLREGRSSNTAAPPPKHRAERGKLVFSHSTIPDCHFPNPDVIAWAE